jgi:hypothetical protein
MLLQTNSYIVPKDKRTQHARLVQRFRQSLARLGCDHFEAYEQVGANWSPADTTGRFVQLMRFRDRKHQLAVQAAERNDATAQALIKEFCELINFPYQQQQGLFAVGFYHSLLPSFTPRATAEPAAEGAGENAQEDGEDMAEPRTAVAHSPIPEPSEAFEESSLSVAGEVGEENLTELEGLTIEPESDEIDPDAEALLDEIESVDESSGEAEPFHSAPRDGHEK